MYADVHNFINSTKHELIDNRLAKSLPKVFNDLLDTFALSTSECLESATAQKDRIVEAVGALEISLFSSWYDRAEFVRLWRCAQMKHPMLSAKLFSLTRFATNCFQTSRSNCPSSR